MHRPLYEIAQAIDEDWPAVNKARSASSFIGEHPAHPYLVVMRELDQITDAQGREVRYYNEGAREIVQRFLGNAATWKGETARKIKQELRDLIKAR